MSTKPIGLRWLRMIVWLSGLVFPLPSQNAPDSPARAVVFINGFQYPDNIGDLIRYGTCPPSRSTPRSGATFGEFENLLAAEGFRVYFFDNCVECPGSSIEECGEALGRYLERHSAGEVAPSGFDLVAHSMGGLIARAYLSGMKRGAGFDPPLLHRVRKLVTLGTPHFGSYRSLDLPFVSAQLPQMVPGSRFLWELNRWNAGADDLRGTDALAVVGNACMASWLDAAGDGLVSLQSAALSFARGPERTRVIPYRHTDSAATFCPGKAPLAQVDGPAHLTYRLVRSFLSDSLEWNLIGTNAADDPNLSIYGSAWVAFEDENGDLPPMRRLVSGAGIEWTKSPAGIFSAAFHPAETTDLWFESAKGELIQGGLVITAGGARASTIKWGPWLGGAELIQDRLVLRGANLQPAEGLPRVMVNGAEKVVLEYTHDTALLEVEAGLRGYLTIELSHAGGRATLRIWIE